MLSIEHVLYILLQISCCHLHMSQFT